MEGLHSAMSNEVNSGLVRVIMEYLVNTSKRRTFWSLNEDILKINDSDNQYAISIKEDTARHSKTLSLDELRSPDFNLLSDQEYSEEEVAETMAETMEQYMSKTRADYGSGVSRPKIVDKDNFELKGQFLKELRTNTFSGSDHEDTNEHIEKVLEIVDLFHILNINIDLVMLRAFPMSLTRAASHWLRNEPTGSITTWEEDSTVTYTEVSSLFEDLSDIGSPGVIVYGYNGLPMMLEDLYVEATLQASPSPDYAPGPEEPEQAPSPVYVPEPVYPEFMPPEDEMLLVREQPLHAVVSPTADSPRYIADSDPEEDPTDYPDDGGDDDDDDDESSDDDEDDDDVKEDEDEEEEEHPAPADFVPPPVRCVTAKMSVRAQTPISLPSDTEVARLLAIPTPLPSPLSPLSSPLPSILSPLPQILSPPLPVSPPPLFASPTYPLGYRAAMIRLRAKTPTTSHSLPPHPSGIPPLLPIPSPTSLPPLLLPSTDHRVDRPKVCLPPRKRLCITLGPRYEVGESSYASATRPPGGFRADCNFIATLDREIRRDPERGIGRRMTEFITTVRQDTDEIYRRLNGAQDDRSLMSAQLNILRRDRRTHAHTALLMKREARLSRKAWRWSMDASDIARSEVMALRTTVLAQQVEIVALRTAERTQQAQLMETLRLVSSLQTQVTALQRQQGPARGPVQPEIPEEAGSSS
ncbi:hypothetical protein Tco_0105288 [Tanacetum coccineum]